MLCAQYGNHNSFYGNIQLGRFAFPILAYGGWPRQEVILEPVADPTYRVGEAEPVIISAPTIEDISERIGIIKRLKAELAINQDSNQRQSIRAKLDEARKEKERQFKLKARIDEEEAMFILLY